MRRLAGILILGLVLTGAVPAGAQQWATPGGDQYFRVEFDVTPGTRGPQLAGSVHNLGDNPADNVRVLVDALDARGAVTGQTLAYVIGIIPIKGHRRFTTSVPIGASYRVSVVNFDWFGRGGGF